MDISNANVWNVGTNSWTDKAGVPYNELNKIEIKTCLSCGYTGKHPYKTMFCPECDMPSFAYFVKGLEGLVSNIEMYGLKRIWFKDEQLRRDVLAAFGITETA